MADILKITTPLVNKSQGPDMKKNVELNTQFNLQDTTKVTKPNSQTELLKQNNGMLQQEETSALLLNLLKDPSVTVNFLKNIFAMQEIIKLLPMNNNSFTQELEQLFTQMMVRPEDIASEMQRQEQSSTAFKGELFDFLREALSSHPEQKDLQASTVNFLKALVANQSKGEALGSVANSLSFLAESLEPSKSLSVRLYDLAARYRAADAGQNFDGLKRETFALFKDVEDSILYSPKLAKVVSIATYNLSRFNDNESFLQESVSQVLSQLRGEGARETFLQQLRRYVNSPPERWAAEKDSSAVMSVLTRILGRQVSSEELMLVNSDKVEKIIYSLLSSPCNFTPLLHFVVPVEYEELQSFAEMWVNPNGEEDDKHAGQGAKKSTHMLLVFDITGIGRFEMELFVRGETIDFSLFCPPAYAAAYREMEKDLSRCLEGSDYRFGEIHIDKLERSRSLMDVFRSLPYKRTGVDVKV